MYNGIFNQEGTAWPDYPRISWHFTTISFGVGSIWVYAKGDSGFPLLRPLEMHNTSSLTRHLPHPWHERIFPFVSVLMMILPDSSGVFRRPFITHYIFVRTIPLCSPPGTWSNNLDVLFSHQSHVMSRNQIVLLHSIRFQPDYASYESCTHDCALPTPCTRLMAGDNVDICVVGKELLIILTFIAG